MPVPAGPLVGRNRELVVLDGALARVRRERSSAVVVLGEAGIGKTRFLQEIHRLARAEEVILRGSASEFGGSLPYGAFVAALADYVQTIDPRLLGTLDDQQHATLAGLLPSYPIAPSAPASRTIDAQYQAHRSIRALLQCLGTAKPHILVLDDLHWADPATITTVSSLLRRPPMGPVLFLCAARLRQVPAGLLAPVREAVAAGYADCLELAPLTLSESRQLLDPGLSDDLASELLAASGGNPFYLEQLRRIWSTRRLPRSDTQRGDVDADLPPMVAAALTDELDALDDVARQFLRGAAVVGDPFEADLAQQTAEVSDEDAVRAMDALLQGDVIRHTDVPRRFQFRHPLLRRAVYETTPGGWQLAAHERCAQELERRGASPVLLAGHLEHAGRHGDQHAITTLVSAGELLRTRSPLDAARFFAAALRLLPTGLHARRAALGAALTATLAAGGRFAEARRACADTISLLGEGDTEVQLELAFLSARLDQALGNHEEAHALLTDTLERLPPGSTPRRVDVLTQLSVDGFYALDLAAMAVWAERARATAATLGDPLHEIRTISLVALAATLDGDTDSARHTSTSAANAVDVLNDDQFFEDPNVLGTLATTEYFLDRYARANDHVERALTVARASGRGQYVPLLYWSGTIRAARGDLQQALDILEQAVEIARIIDYSVGIAWNRAAQAVVLSARGETDRALEAAREASALTTERTAILPAELARLAHATVLLQSGRPDRALAELAACGHDTGPAGLPMRWQPAALEVASRCHLALGRTSEARRLLVPLTATANAIGLPTAFGAARRAAAAVALSSSDPELAEQHATAAIDAFAAAGAVLEAEKSRVLLGRALAASGRAGRAVEHFTRAGARFEDCSANGLRAEVDRELRKLGRRRSRRPGPPSPRDPLAPLSSREREVALLVAEGRTNPQIAAELFLSGKTVESHVRSAFHKLSVTSRLELARLVDRGREQDS